MDSISRKLSRDLREKYRAGQQEHGGDIWTKPGMLANATHEVIDLAVYLYTVREQLDLVYTMIRNKLYGDAEEFLYDILNKPQD